VGANRAIQNTDYARRCTKDEHREPTRPLPSTRVVTNSGGSSHVVCLSFEDAWWS
jgi:hypothetical protein